MNFLKKHWGWIVVAIVVVVVVCLIQRYRRTHATGAPSGIANARPSFVQGIKGVLGLAHYPAVNDAPATGNLQIVVPTLRL